MAGGLSLDHPWVFTVGMLGNIISFVVYLAPLATFYRVYKKKSTEGFQSVPYIIALFSASLWIYYALVKDENSSLLVTINSIGCFIESIYVIMFLIYAPKDAKVFTLKMVVFLNIGLYGLILLLTILLTKGSERTVIVGWICVGFSVSVFAAPLSIIRLVIKTKSVEFMPFSLSCSLTVSAVVWFLYGLLTKDRYVAMPNVLGFGFGVLQMVLYIIYKDVREVKKITQEIALPGHVITINVGTTEVHPIGSNREGEGKGDGEEQKAECSIKESMGGHQESMEHEV